MGTKNIKNRILMAIVVLSSVLFQNIGVYASENVINIPLKVKQEFNISNKDQNLIDMSGKYELKAISENAPIYFILKIKLYILRLLHIFTKIISNFFNF